MKTKVDKIILATDFSETSQDAMEYAAWLSQTLGAELQLLHVFDPSIYNIPSPYYFMPGFDQWYSDNISDIRDKGKKALKELEKSFQSKVEAIFAEGQPGKVIARVAEEWEADLIVMGTHGYTGWNRLTLGSVAEYVLRHSQCPVLTIKQAKKEE